EATNESALQNDCSSCSTFGRSLKCTTLGDSAKHLLDVVDVLRTGVIEEGAGNMRCIHIDVVPKKLWTIARDRSQELTRCRYDAIVRARWNSNVVLNTPCGYCHRRLPVGVQLS